MIPTPHWHAGRPLSYTDLVGLEHYVCERSSFIDRGACGVDRIDLRHSVRSHLGEGGTVLEVADVRGVTEAGLPVVIDADASVAVTLSTCPVVDLAVDVNPEEPTDKGKYVLRAEDVDPSAAAGTVSTHSLYLGRWRIDTTPPICLALPRVRRLGAVVPHEERWLVWVEPVTELLDRLTQETSRPAASPALSTELLRLRLDWARITVTELAWRLKSLEVLLEWDDEKALRLQSWEAPDASSAGGESQPREIANVFSVSVGGARRRLDAGDDYHVLAENHAELKIAFRESLPAGRLELHTEIGHDRIRIRAADGSVDHGFSRPTPDALHVEAAFPQGALVSGLELKIWPVQGAARFWFVGT